MCSRTLPLSQPCRLFAFLSRRCRSLPSRGFTRQRWRCQPCPVRAEGLRAAHRAGDRARTGSSAPGSPSHTALRAPLRGMGQAGWACTGNGGIHVPALPACRSVCPAWPEPWLSVCPSVHGGCAQLRAGHGHRSTPRRGDAIYPCLLRVRAAEPVHDRGRKRWQRRGCRDTPKAHTARSAGGRAGPAWPWRLRRRGARAVPLRRRRGKARAAPLSRPRVTARSRPRPTWRRRPHGRAPRPLR